MSRSRTASARDPGEAGQDAALGFRLALDEGRAVLELPEACVSGPVRVETLRLEIPEVRYPFDLSAGLARFQRRRCLLRALTAALPVAEVSAWLAGAPLARYGLHDLHLAVGPGGLRLVLRAELAGRAALVSARLNVRVLPGGRLRASIDGRAYGFLPVPVPLLIAGLFTALGLPVAGLRSVAPGAPAVREARWWSRPPSLVAPAGTTAFDLEALDLILYPLLVGRGWRLPERGKATVAAVTVVGGELRLDFQADGQKPGAAPGGAPTVADDSDLLTLGEEALAGGELRAAREAFRHAARAVPGGRAEGRLLSLLLASAETLAAAAEEAAAQLVRRPDDPEARLAQAVVAGEAGRFEEAASLLARAAARWEAEGEPLEAACAHHAASEALERAGQHAEAQAQLARALASWGQERGALRERWIERLGGKGAAASVAAAAVPEGLLRARASWQAGDLSVAARHYEAILAERPPAGEGAAEGHLRLAQWARLNGQMMVATRHLAQALKLEGDAARAAPLVVLVEVLEGAGRGEDLEAALVRRRARAGRGPAGAEVAAALGRLLERTGRAPAAVALYEGLLAEDPHATGPEVLETLGRLAEIHRRESQQASLAQVLERLFTRGLGEGGGATEVDLEGVGLELAQLHEDLGARERAAAVLERLCAARPSSSEAREALAALDRRPTGAED